MPGHFEAKKHAYRQTQDGIVISFVMHPDDVSQAIAMAPLGTRFMVGFAEIGDDERPVETPVGKLEDEPPNAVMPKKRDAAQIAGARCKDKNFQHFIHENYNHLWKGTWNNGDEDYDERETVRLVRFICGVQSRAHIPDNPTALERWQHLEGRFQNWRADKQYAGSIR